MVLFRSITGRFNGFTIAWYHDVFAPARPPVSIHRAGSIVTETQTRIFKPLDLSVRRGQPSCKPHPLTSSHSSPWTAFPLGVNFTVGWKLFCHLNISDVSNSTICQIHLSGDTASSAVPLISIPDPAYINDTVIRRKRTYPEGTIVLSSGPPITGGFMSNHSSIHSPLSLSSEIHHTYRAQMTGQVELPTS